MAKLPIKLCFSESGFSFEVYSSHASQESAEKKRDKIMDEARERRHTFLYNGWWVVLDTSVKPWKRLSEFGVGKAEGKTMPVLTRIS